MRILHLTVFVMSLASRLAAAETVTIWCAIQIRSEAGGCITSSEASREITARTLDDKTLEYLNAVARTPEEYARLRSRILERAWIPGLHSIARERIWESSGKELSLSVTKKHFREALRLRMESDEQLGIAEIRRILGREIKGDAADAEILRYRKTQQQERVMTELRAGFARAVQDALHARRGSSITSPGRVRARYEELKSRSAQQTHWQGYASQWMDPREANRFASRLHAILGDQARRRHEDGQTWWELPSARFQAGRDLRPIDPSELPESWSSIKPDSLTAPRALMAATDGTDSRVRIELWVASRVPVPEWQDAYPAIERELRAEERHAILEKHFAQTASRIGVILSVEPNQDIRGEALLQRLSNF